MDEGLLEIICQSFPFLVDAGPEVREQFLSHAVITRLPKGRIIFLEGDECSQLALIMSGFVRVYKVAESGGREITLYRLEKGESCVLTASCIFSHGRFPAIAVVEEEIEAAMIPANVFREWINLHEVWRNYIFNLLAKRLSEALSTIDEVAFRRMDARIAEYLSRPAPGGRGEIGITHQDIAVELGTSREVVSRILKNFEYEGLISLGRGTIRIRDMKGLAKRAEQI